ncbi:unnamed protein product [Trifolium pratense]|uniref:Uncharacterized protein n=1 Tax=Trifolium pratense TaxID=57577 RepID=A0ACB0JBH5_TRIPR|nr:unnamed protein product [Trifolium pratense]
MIIDLWNGRGSEGHKGSLPLKQTNNNEEPHKEQHDEVKPESEVLTQDLSGIDGSGVYTGLHGEEAMQLNSRTLASTTVSQKSQPLVDSAPFLSYSLFDDNADKSQGQQKIVADPVLEINTEMDHLDTNSSIDTHCVLPISIPVIIPPPEPPDRVVIPMLSLNLFLPVTTTKHFVSIAPTCMYSFSLLQNSCQLFEEKPLWHNSEYPQWLYTLPPPKPPKTNHRDSMTCESPFQFPASLAPTCSMKLPWFWVKELRIADPILDWEKLKRAIFERLLFDTPPNDNSNATETLTLPLPMPPDQDFQRTKAIVKVFHYYFLIEAGGIKHIIGELLDKHLISQWYEAKEFRFCAPNFLLSLLAIFGSKIWIMNLVYEESQSLYLMALGSNIGTHTLVKINDGKNMDSYYGVLTTSFFLIAKLHVSHLDASLDKEKGDNRVYHGDNFFSVTSTNFGYFGKHMILESLKCRKETYKDLVAVMIPAKQEWWRKYPSSDELVIELRRQGKFSYCKYCLLCLHLGISNGVFNYLIGLCINMAAIQKKKNYKFKVQGLPSIVTSDFNQYFISTVWKEPFQIQGDSMINSIASSPNSNFLSFLGCSNCFC